MTREQLSTHFSRDELACRHCGRLQLHPGFLDSLQYLRWSFGEPLPVLSGGRCAEHNAAVGGHPRSLHVLDREQHPGMQGTLAVDILATDGAYRGDLFSAAWGVKWSIGWNAARGFLHLDRRNWLGLPQTSFNY